VAKANQSALITRKPYDWASSNKLHGAASAPKVLPSAQPLHAITESAVVSAPVKVEQPQYGMRLVATLEHILSASETRVVESVASVGDTLTSLAKKL
jgi:hypothetical protein